MAKKDKSNDEIKKTEKEATEGVDTEAKEDKADAACDVNADIEALNKELAAAKEAHIRTLAEYDNFRKRSAREKEGTWIEAKASCVSELLPMLDNFERALSVSDSDLESYKKGVEMIYQGFNETLKKLGVEAFGEEGDSFDPNFHSAVMHIDDASFEENVIAQVFSKGYKIGDKVLRPAMVKVAN